MCSERKIFVEQMDKRPGVRCLAGKLCLEGVFHQGFGIVPKFVMHDQDLTLEGKAIYAYLCSLAGSGEQTFPFRGTILRHLGLSKNTYYRHYGLLLQHGYLTAERPADKTAANLYTLVQNPKKLPVISTKGAGSHLRYRGLKAHGYGSLPRSVMMDESLNIKAKGLYAYLCSYCGGGDTAFPRRDDILFHLGVSEPTYYKMLGQLKDAGYLEVVQRKDAGRFAVNDYLLSDYPAGKQETTPPPSPDRTKTKPQKAAPNPARTPSKLAAPQKPSSPPPCPKTWDIENGDTIFGDIENRDASIYNSLFNNNSSSNNPSTAGTDGQIHLHSMAKEFMESLLHTTLRETKGTVFAAREYLLRASKNPEREEELALLREEFVRHLEKGLRNKQVRNLKAYCKTSLYNWLAEQPLRQEARVQPSSGGTRASYDLELLEWMVDSGAQLALRQAPAM